MEENSKVVISDFVRRYHDTIFRSFVDSSCETIPLFVLFTMEIRESETQKVMELSFTLFELLYYYDDNYRSMREIQIN